MSNQEAYNVLFLIAPIPGNLEIYFDKIIGKQDNVCEKRKYVQTKPTRRISLQLSHVVSW